MRVINVMKDGSVRDSVKGVVIPNKEFYKIYNEIRSRKNEKANTTVSGRLP